MHSCAGSTCRPSCATKLNTHSRSQWLEARRRWDRFDLALQFLVRSGDADSVYRTLPLRQSVELTLRYYLQ